MNASRLRELLDLLLSKEATHNVQKKLGQVGTFLNQLVEQPQNPEVQKGFSSALDDLRSTYAAMRASWEPAQIPLLQEIGAAQFFLDDFSVVISTSLKENPVSPAVTKQKFDPFVAERSQYIKKITQLRDHLKELGIEASSLSPGEAEIGFLLPRDLFKNRFSELLKELRDIQRIIRAFSEATIGTVEEVEVREISTSDPQFFFALSAATIAALAKAVTWALSSWKQVEEIRKVRVEIRKTDVLSEKEADEFFDKKIAAKITAALDAKVDELVKDVQKPGREKEQRIDLRWALESILAHVERGMLVEVRFVPPPPSVPNGAPDGTAPSVPPEFQTLRSVTPDLVFPKMEGTPILKLPPQPTADTA